MSAPRSLPATSPARQSSICANPAPPRSRTIASQPSVNMGLRPRHVSLAGLRIESLSLTRISAFPVPARSRDRALPVSPPKWRSHVSVLYSGSRCRGSLAITLIGTGSSISPASTDTLIGDADGIYHPALFNDRLLLGLKGPVASAHQGAS